MFIRSEVHTECIEFNSKHRLNIIITLENDFARFHAYLNLLYNYNYDIRIIVNNLLYRGRYSRFRRMLYK